MLQLLKETASSRHAERLEKIVILLIGIEIGAWGLLSYRPAAEWPGTVIGITTILVDLWA